MNKASGTEVREQWLSIVIIGCNEGENLPRLFKSLPQDEAIEWIYVDSRSKDDSVSIALQKGARVYLVEEESVYAPATGRHIGTREAAGHWLLYLDGDMALEDQFKKFITGLRREELIPPHTGGFVGRTRNICLTDSGAIEAERDYVTLSRREMGPPESWGRPATYHGGAVLYRRTAVLEAGNWNPAVSQLEEVDLCSRISARGWTLRAVDLPMVRHYTPYHSFSERMKLNFSLHWSDKRPYGAGEVVAARCREDSLRHFVRYYPYPFLVFAGLVTAPFFYLIWPPLPLLLNFLLAAWICRRKKWYYYLVYLGNLVQMARGIGRYRPFEPAYREVKPLRKKIKN
jgi:glycosyltransferase involved in cell wall biosynthesis